MVKDFLGNRRGENRKKLVEKLLQNLQEINANMSIKVHFFFIAVSIDFRITVAISKKNDSIRISKQWKRPTRTVGQTNDDRLLLEYQKGLK